MLASQNRLRNLSKIKGKKNCNKNKKNEWEFVNFSEKFVNFCQFINFLSIFLGKNVLNQENFIQLASEYSLSKKRPFKSHLKH